MKIETYTNKERLIGKMKPNLFYYAVLSSSDERGYNKTIHVFCLEKKTLKPLTIGYAHINTAAYKGDKATAHNLISEIVGHKMADGYCLLSNKINVYQV